MRRLIQSDRRSSPTAIEILRSTHGFTFIEVLVAMTLTVIVMGAVFGLLAAGSSTSTEEFDRAELQAQARHALEMIGRDVMLAGTDLPPEFPSLGGQAHHTLPPNTPASSQEIEIIGNLEGDAAWGGPIPVESFDGRTAALGVDQTHFARGDLVVVYDDEPTNGKWMFGLVEGVVAGPSPQLLLLTSGGARIDDANPSVELPLTIHAYNRPFPSSGFVTRVSVVAYGVEGSGEAQDRSLLWRQVNWGDRVDVAFVEDLEVRYFVGGTVDEPFVPAPIEWRKNQPFGRLQGQSGGGAPGKRPGDSSSGEIELSQPPLPQPDPSRRLQSNAVVRGVGISLRARSRLANLRGSSLEAGELPNADGFLRHTLSTRIATRNLIMQADRRNLQAQLGDDEGP